MWLKSRLEAPESGASTQKYKPDYRFTLFEKDIPRADLPETATIQNWPHVHQAFCGSAQREECQE